MGLGGIGEQGFAEFGAGAVEVGADSVDGDGEGMGDLLVGLVLLVKEDEDGALDVAELLEVVVDGAREVGLLELGFGGGCGVGEGGLQGEVFVVRGDGGGEGEVAAAVLGVAAGGVVGDVEGDAIEVGGKL